jgi:hypothetical protein
MTTLKEFQMITVMQEKYASWRKQDGFALKKPYGHGMR